MGWSASITMVSKHNDYRMQAAVCEKRAEEATDREIKRQWQEIAIQWHFMANQAARMFGDPEDEKYR